MSTWTFVVGFLFGRDVGEDQAAQVDRQPDRRIERRGLRQPPHDVGAPADEREVDRDQHENRGRPAGLSPAPPLRQPPARRAATVSMSSGAGAGIGGTLAVGSAGASGRIGDREGLALGRSAGRCRVVSRPWPPPVPAPAPTGHLPVVLRALRWVPARAGQRGRRPPALPLTAPQASRAMGLRDVPQRVGIGREPHVPAAGAAHRSAGRPSEDGVTS